MSETEKHVLPSKNPEELYGAKFHADRYSRTIYAATTVLRPLIKNFGIHSVVDFGCGVGTWLDASKSLDVERIFGIEGPWIPRDQVKIDVTEYVCHDLTEPTSLDQHFDLAISLEVGEHLPPHRASSFVSELCKSAKFVLFSAAIPKQGGQGHVNEQWQSYWAALFGANEFLPLDCIRPTIWGDDQIDWWYQQNIILYVSKNNYEEAKKICGFGVVKHYEELNMVHPRLYEMKLEKNETFWPLFYKLRNILLLKIKL